MIYLRTIHLKNFKGVSELTCDFEDLTLLAGLNNSGKTTLLQSIYLLTSSLHPISEHRHKANPNPENRKISMGSALPHLGLRDMSWLRSHLFPEVEGTITGVFGNGLRVELGVIKSSNSEFLFTLTCEDGEPIGALSELQSLTASILTPPGDVPTREPMHSEETYRNQLREGKGAQLWRNGMWWEIQKNGSESFKPVQDKIRSYFPDVELLLPTLSFDSSPEILIKYKERGLGPLDIAQSGAGLRTFMSLSRILDQSSSQIVLLDEPDSHLHASQQAIIVELILDVASAGNRQVIVASHSPEVISRIPSECIRWVDRNNQKAEGGFEIGQMFDQMGVASNTYVLKREMPDLLVYVEGVDDRPVIEAVIKWCRKNTSDALPTTLVIPHRDGRFEGPTLQGIVRLARELRREVKVVGIRDLDWYYHERPSEEPCIDNGDGWSVITLPCKELENLFCESQLLSDACGGVLSVEEVQAIIEKESAAEELVEEWRYQVRHRIRDRLPKNLDASSREEQSEKTFNEWEADPQLRNRLVAGKMLLGRIRKRIRDHSGIQLYPNRILEKSVQLPPLFMSIANAIFPGFNQTAEHQ